MLYARSGSKSSSHSQHSGRKGPSQSGDKGNFDYYVMALSWSPSYCESHPDEDEQCAHKGYGFVLHGLWPQYDGGGGPEEALAAKPTQEFDAIMGPSDAFVERAFESLWAYLSPDA